MGRKKRNTDNRSKPPPVNANVNHPQPLANTRGDDADVTEHDPSLPQLALENEVSFAIESEGYSALKTECEKALLALRRGNHTKALRLMKELIGKHENTAHLALIHRVQGTVCVKVANIMDDVNSKQRYVKSAVESAKKAVMLSPNSIEFAHFYANLLCETAADGKDYDDSVKECERALMVKNPVDPGKEGLQDESQQKSSTPDACIGHVQNELRALSQRANIGSISSWMRSLNNGEDKFRIIPINRAPDDPMDVTVVQATRPNDIKKASKTVEERKKEIEVKVAAARLLQQKMESSKSQTEWDKGLESSSGPSQRTGQQRKSGKAKKNTYSSQRKDFVLPYWKSMGTDLKKDLFKIRVTDIKNHFKSLKDGLAYEVITEALLFGVGHNSWRYWMCCKCSEKFADPKLHQQHVHEHMESLSPKLQTVLPLNVDHEWTEMLLTHPWRPLDVDAAVRMIELQSGPSVSNSELVNNRFSGSYGYQDMWDLSYGQKKYEDGFNHDNWPLSNDIERIKLLEKIRTLFHLLIKHKCLASSHLTKVIQFAAEELHPQLVNCNLDQSPFCICLLGATELRKVLMFLQELTHSCGLGRYLERSNTLEELNSVVHVNEMAEKLVFDQDGSCLLLNANTCQDDDDDDFLSWIFSGPSSREELTFWTGIRTEKMYKGMEILETISKEFSHLQSLCDRKLELITYEEALQLIDDLCLEEDKRREHALEFVCQSYESILIKRREEVSRLDNDATQVNRFELEVLTNVLKETDFMNVNSHECDLESGEYDYIGQLDSCIKTGIQKQKEQLSVEFNKVDARIMRNLSEMANLEAKLGLLCGHDFGLIVVPLVKSYLRALIENLAEKDATKKSDAAREAFLAELALDSKKKGKDKRKNKESRKTKNSKLTSGGDLHLLPNDDAENISSSPHVTDEQPNGSVAFYEQEDEARRLKIELEAEERKLEATLEYPRRIEDETKQRYLAEQHKYSSRMTPMSMEPINQSNGVLITREDGLTERTDTSSGDNETRILMLQSQEDDEKRFQADLSKAVRQSLDAFLSHKQYSSVSELMMPEENIFLEGSDSIVTYIEVPSDKVNGSEVYGTGLKNEVGEYNCFLNVIIQSLWHLRRFREEFLSTSTSFHLHVGDPCVTCALYDIFSALNSASIDSKVQAVAPTPLRVALSKLYPESSFFQEAQMNDASEVLGVIFDCLHKSFTSVTDNSDTERVENNITGYWECINKACTAHSLFGLNIYERMDCYNCGLETRCLKYTSFFHQINASALRTMKVMCPEGSFDELLNQVEMNHQLACDLDDGGCGKLNYIHHILSTPPHVFTTVIGWQNTCESVEDIKPTLAALSTEIDLSVLYRGLDPNNTRRLVSVVCYYGQHYHCFAYSHVHHRWVMYDDKTVKVIGGWDYVVLACEKGHLQPQVLFYEAIK
ncbi:uncharacterized protein LOC143628280 [Bidens hawaiensis]|uniref:uncharacterized protein LOC143628280 n=1 Tax=Bidens hawaiensis TaxID=980011 RepID=UPI00404A3A59